MNTHTRIFASGILMVWVCAGCGGFAPGAAPSGAAPSVKTVVLGQGGGTGKPAPAQPGVNVPAIKVDTVGYEIGWPKVVIFNVDPIGAVVKRADGQVALAVEAAQIDERGTDAASQDPVWQVDIGALDAPGTYTIAVGDETSDPFVVGTGVYREALHAGLKSFYFQRTRCALPEPYAVWQGDKYLRKGVSHAHGDVGWDLEDYPKKKRRWQVEGGWHDAGNFDMYIPSTAPSAQALLMAYEWAPALFDDRSLNIPESGNGIPDLLDEVEWGLVWVLSLQEPGGAFRAREAVMEWSPECPADEDETVRWISGPSSAATAKAVAVLAQAARVYAPHDAAFAARCERAAKQGWAWLGQHPEHLRHDGKGSQQPLWDDEPGNTDIGARFVAAVQMWIRFRDQTALARVRELMQAAETTVIEDVVKGAWANLSRWGLGDLALDPETPADLREEARRRMLAAADLLLPRVTAEDGYRCASALDDYYWAHNSNLMEKTHLLAVAARLAPDRPEYLAAARDQWHWVLGRNPNGYSMVTRVGKGPARMYHMEWGPFEPPPPGFLLGGPNSQNMGFLAPGAPAKALLWDNPAPLRTGLAAHSLWHWRQSDLWDGKFVPEGEWTEGWWAVTEPDILYSANLVLAGVSVH